MQEQYPSGSFAITEQGDLGLGLTPIDESVLEKDKENKDKEKRDHK